MLSGLLNCTRCSKAIGWAQQLTFRTPKLICCWQASYRLCIRHCRTRTCVLTRFQSLITLLTEAIRGRKAGQDRAPATHPIIQARRGNPALHKEISNRVLHLNSRFLNRRPEWDASACEPERTRNCQEKQYEHHSQCHKRRHSHSDFFRLQPDQQFEHGGFERRIERRIFSEPAHGPDATPGSLQSDGPYAVYQSVGAIQPA